VELTMRLTAATRQEVSGGPRAPSEVAAPTAVLDAVADRGGLRWSRSSTMLDER